jgi:branched-chain amino acid transport system ATP-binding protein
MAESSDRWRENPPAVPSRHAQGVALELREVVKRFGRTEIVRGASLQVRAGERVALIGPNGAGKSTLFDLVCGLLAPSAGEILLHGRRIDGLAPHAVYRRGLARSFQVSNLFTRLSVFENLRCALLWPLGTGYAFWRRLSSMDEANARADALVRRLGLLRRRDTLATDLTYAEQRALEIGMTLAGGSQVVLLDEPTAGMSLAETRQVVDLIRDVTQGRTLLVVEHDMGVVFDLADRIAVLVHGEVIAFDTPAAVRADRRVQEAYLGSALASGAADVSR